MEEYRVLCVILKNELRIFHSLFDFINNIENVIKINSMDIIKLNNELQKQNNRVQISVEINNKPEIMYLKYVDIIQGWDINELDNKKNIMELI